MRHILLTVTTLLVFARLTHADLIGVGFQGNVYRINEQTGTAQLINQVPAGINCLAGPYQGKLYGIAGDNLYVLGLNGALLNTVPLETSDFRAAAISPNGTLYASHTIVLQGGGAGFLSELNTINVSTGDVTFVGIHDLGIGALDFSQNGTLYGWDIGQDGSGTGLGLVIMPLDNGDYTDVNPLVGTPGAQIQSLAFAPNGILYAARNQLFTVNTATGVWLPVGATAFNWDVRGLAYVPEPATWITLAIGLAGAARIARRRRCINQPGD